MSRNVRVFLTGGLGNQLFQLAAGLSALDEISGRVLLDTKLGKPRTTLGAADVLHFRLPENVIEYSRNSNILSERTAGFLLRSGINPSVLEKRAIMQNFTRDLGRIVLSLRYKATVNIEIAKDVGFHPIHPHHNPLLIGYFQSYKYLQNPKVKENLFALSPKDGSRKLNALVANALEQKPIFVHVRLSDYLNEKHFGTPGKEYYLNSLSRLNGISRNIWVFSDDLDLAKSRMPIEFNDRYFYVDDSELSPAQLLHLLRYGQDYVVANSSFSWWGAALSFNRDSKIIAPDPWFAGMPEPRELIPPHWHREKAYS